MSSNTTNIHVSESSEALQVKARQILQDNDRGGYTIPTSTLYPYQWNWDSAFCAWGFATFDLPRAWQEIETLLSGQWKNGMLPHILFHREDSSYFPGPDVWQAGYKIQSSGITQPPVVTSMVSRLVDLDIEQTGKKLASLFPKLYQMHDWFMRYRAESGAIAITHPWESGRDNSPDWDKSMQNVDTSGVGDYQRRDIQHVDAKMRPQKIDYDRYLAILYHARDHGWDEEVTAKKGPFRVADPLMSFVLLRGHHDLLALAHRSNQSIDTIATIERWISTLTEGINTLWNPEIQSFDAKDLRTGEFAGGVSSSAYLCWYAGIHNDAMLAHLKRQFAAVKYSVPSFDAEHAERFESKRYWRGPVWAIVNTMIGIGLAEQGYQTEADRIKSDTDRLIQETGFYEYFDPIDASGAGGGQFSWTAAVWLAWVNGSMSK